MVIGGSNSGAGSQAAAIGVSWNAAVGFLTIVGGIL
jgi:hypothetical protein